MDGQKAFDSIDEYIESFPRVLQDPLWRIRAAIREAAPEAREKISYRMPTFELDGNLVHFAMHSKHIGFYPTPSAMEAFDQELSPWLRSKGAVQFPLGQPLPLELIKRMVRFRVKENREKAAAKGKGRR